MSKPEPRRMKINLGKNFSFIIMSLTPFFFFGVWQSLVIVRLTSDAKQKRCRNLSLNTACTWQEFYPTYRDKKEISVSKNMTRNLSSFNNWLKGRKTARIIFSLAPSFHIGRYICTKYTSIPTLIQFCVLSFLCFDKLSEKKRPFR